NFLSNAGFLPFVCFAKEGVNLARSVDTVIIEQKDEEGYKGKSQVAVGLVAKFIGNLM
ncbi:hypothetical protein ACJX0J_031067, partial [Zea mays]